MCGVYSRCIDKPVTLNPQSQTLKPQPSNLSPQPSTLNPQPSTLNPKPQTPNPQPQTYLYSQEAVAERDAAVQSRATLATERLVPNILLQS